MSAEKYKGKYNIKSDRCPNWDYGSNAAYYVTICTKNRECFFGDIVAGKMRLSDIGEIAKTEWLKTPGIRPDMNLKLDEYVVMPNHLHGIIIIGENIFNNYNMGRRDAMHCVSTMRCASTTTTIRNKNQFGPQRNNLASIIRGYKSAVTIRARRIQNDFRWQSGFHDRIIRNKNEFDRIRTYISENPSQ